MLSPGYHADVLLVDDDEAAARLLGQLLDGEGYTISWAKDGHEALDLLRGGVRPALILLDLVMPVMDGWGP
jgi:CheY-like chemotaxis protein